jgi:F-type H+-transporting ATPase subunit alpha
LDAARQVIIIYAGTNGYLDDLAVGMVRKFEHQLYKFIDVKFPGLQSEIETQNDLDANLKNKLDVLITEFKKEFLVNS